VDATGEAKVEVTGREFRLNALAPYGGPVIKISSFSLTCSTDANGSRSSIRMTGLSGIPVPNPIPANHTVINPGVGSDSPPVARIIVNEVITPIRPDGGITVNLMHLTLFPEGAAIDGGAVVLGSVSCSPNPGRAT
jgi:hypothetical protein